MSESNGGGGVADRAKWLSGAFDKKDNGEDGASRSRARNARSPTRVADRAKWLTSGEAFEKKNGGDGAVTSPPPSGNSGLISDRLKFLEEQKNKKDGEDVGKARALEARGASGAVADRAKWLATGEAFKKEESATNKEPTGPKSTITADRLKFLEEKKNEDAEKASKARAAEISSESRVADRAQWLATGEAFKKEEDDQKEVLTPTSTISADRLKFLEETNNEAAEKASKARAAEISSESRVADRAQWLATGEAFKKEEGEKEVLTPTSTISADRLKFLEENNQEDVEKARRARAEEAKNTSAHVAERAQWLATGEAFKKEEVERQELVSPTSTISADRLKFLEENKKDEAEKASRARALEAKAADAQVAERAQWLATGEAFKKEEVERQELVSPTATISADRLKFLEENKKEEAEKASRARALEAKAADAQVAERAQWLDTGEAFKKDEVERQEQISPTATITADRLKFLEETHNEEAEKASKARALEAQGAEAHVAERAQWLDTGEAFKKEEVERQELLSPTSTITADRLKFLEETSNEEAEMASKLRAEEARTNAEALVSDRAQWLSTGEAFKKEDVERQELVSPTSTISAERLRFLEDQKKKEDAEKASRARAEEAAKNAEALVSDRAQWLTGEAFRKDEAAAAAASTDKERVPPSKELIAARLKWLDEESKKQQEAAAASNAADNVGHSKIAEKLRWLEEQAAMADDDEFADALEELDTNEEVAAKARWLEDRAAKEKERCEA